MARDHKATYRARDALAKSQGYRSLRHRTEMRKAGKALPTDTTVGKNRRVVTTKAGTLIRSGSTRGKLGGVMRSLRARAGDGSIIEAIRITYKLGDGTKTVELESRATGHGSVDVQLLVWRIDAAGGLADYAADAAGEAYGADGVEVSDVLDVEVHLS